MNRIQLLKRRLEKVQQELANSPLHYNTSRLETERDKIMNELDVLEDPRNNIDNATIKALEGKLIENKKDEPEIIKEITFVLNTISKDIADDFKAKDISVKMLKDEIKITYITEEDITKKDCDLVLEYLKPQIKGIIKEYDFPVSNINITFYDRSGRYEDNSLTYKISLRGRNTKFNHTPKLNKEQIDEIVNLMLKLFYDEAYEVVGGSGESIYTFIRKFFNKDSNYYLEDLAKYKKDIEDKVTIKAIASAIIKNICDENDWSISVAKQECGF